MKIKRFQAREIAAVFYCVHCKQPFEFPFMKPKGYDYQCGECRWAPSAPVEEANPMDGVMFALVSNTNMPWAGSTVMSVYRTEEIAQAAWNAAGDSTWSVKPIMTVDQYHKHPKEQKLCVEGRPNLGYIDFESKFKIVDVYFVDEMIYKPEDAVAWERWKPRDNIVTFSARKLKRRT